MDYKCDLCGNSKYVFCYRPTNRLGLINGKYKVVKCAKCGLKSLFPLPDENDFKEIYSKYYAKSSRELVETQRIDWYRHKLELLKEYAKGKKLLDIGAGVGTFLSLANEYAFTVSGVEQLEELCEIAKVKYGLVLFKSKVEDIDFPDDSFDIVNINHVLEHLISPMKILKKIYNLLKKDGILLVEVPNQFDNIIVEFKYLFSRKYSTPSNPIQHFYFFDHKTLRLMLKKTGFQIIRTTQIKESQIFAIKFLIKKVLEATGFGVGNFIEILARK